MVTCLNSSNYCHKLNKYSKFFRSLSSLSLSNPISCSVQSKRFEVRSTVFDNLNFSTLCQKMRKLGTNFWVNYESKESSFFFCSKSDPIMPIFDNKCEWFLLIICPQTSLLLDGLWSSGLFYESSVRVFYRKNFLCSPFDLLWKLMNMISWSHVSPFWFIEFSIIQLAEVKSASVIVNLLTLLKLRGIL